MTDQLEELTKARNALVEARRSAARTLGLPGSKSGNDGRNFTEIQEGIEAIDRAIAELEEQDLEEELDEEDDE